MIYHVSSVKSDQQNYFQDIESALIASRNSTESEKTIIVHEGHYYDVGLEIGPEDSNLTISAATGENPILFGGIPARGWTKVDENIWETDYAPTDCEINMLFVDGKAAQIARLPRQGCFQHLSRYEVKWLSTTYGGWERKPTFEELTTIKVKTEDLVKAGDLTNARIGIYHQWNQSISEVENADKASGVIKLKQRCDHPPGAFYGHDDNKKGIEYIVLNCRKGLTGPGYWCHDKKAGKLLYWPQPGTNPNKSSIIVPTRKTIVKMAGASNVVLSDLTLSCTGSSSEPVSFGGNKAPAALQITGPASGITLLNLNIEKTGGKAIDATSSENEDITAICVGNCRISDSGGPGINILSPGAMIYTNHIQNIGLYYDSSIALKVIGENSVTSNNLVEGCPYTAITGGGKNAVFSGNIVRDYMLRLDDGGAFYFFAGNHLTLAKNEVYGSSGRLAHAYYLDERSVDCVVEDNLAVNTPYCFQGHMANDCIFRHNLVLCEGGTQLAFARCKDFILQDNVFDVGGTIAFKMPSCAIKAMPNNIFHSKSNHIILKLLDELGYEVVETSKMELTDGSVSNAPSPDIIAGFSWQ